MIEMSEQDKAWGTESLIFTTDVNVRDHYDSLGVRKIKIDGEEMTTFHQHEKINKVIYVSKGMVEIRTENDVIEVEQGDAHYLESNMPHQIQNLTSKVVEIIEVCFPFDPNDKEIIEDPYNE